MKKRILLILAVCSALIVTSSVLAFADNSETSVYIDGTQVEFDVPPQSVNNRTMVPIRAIFEKMGADVNWDQTTLTATCTKNETIVKMTVGSNVINVDDGTIVMDVAPVIIDGRTLAPARYVAECFGADVQWDALNNAVIVSTSGVYEPIEILREPEVTLYATDGRKINVAESEVAAYMAVGWYATLAETQQTLYAIDGRTITVYKAEVPSYLNVGWYATLAETQQTLYAIDGRTITVYKAEVPSYLNVGWYSTAAAAQAANKPAQSQSNSYSSGSGSYNPGPDGNVYRTPSGTKYHFDPNCGGKNSYKTTLQKAKNAGLTPCAKCAH